MSAGKLFCVRLAPATSVQEASWLSIEMIVDSYGIIQVSKLLTCSLSLRVIRHSLHHSCSPVISELAPAACSKLGLGSKCLA